MRPQNPFTMTWIRRLCRRRSSASPGTPGGPGARTAIPRTHGLRTARPLLRRRRHRLRTRCFLLVRLSRWERAGSSDNASFQPHHRSGGCRYAPASTSSETETTQKCATSAGGRELVECCLNLGDHLADGFDGFLVGRVMEKHLKPPHFSPQRFRFVFCHSHGGVPQTVTRAAGSGAGRQAQRRFRAW